MSLPVSAAFSFTLNGKRLTISGVDPNTTLLQFLRDDGWTGTKEGCAEGDCGACTVAVLDPERRAFRAINSCLTLLPDLAGTEVITVEGVASGFGRLHPVQERLIQFGGSQCGYCTSGVVMSLFASYYGPRPVPAEDLAGNLCRCTGYLSIRRAAASLDQPAPGDPFLVRLRDARPSNPAGPLSYTAGGRSYHRPTTLAELFSLIERYPGARLVAGGTDACLQVTKAFRPFEELISLRHVAELRQVACTQKAWEIGAAVTLAELEEFLNGEGCKNGMADGRSDACAAPYGRAQEQVEGHVRGEAQEELRSLFDLFPRFASRQIRNVATVGGNLVNASPVADLPPLLLSLGASVRLLSSRGERVLPLDAFFTGYRRVALQPGEVLASVSIPRQKPSGTVRRLARFYKVARRSHVDISIVSAAFCFDLDGDGRILQARCAYGGVASTPRRAYRAEAALAGRPLDKATIEGVIPLLQSEFEPISDLRAPAEYRRALIVNLLCKFGYEEAHDRVGA